MKKEYDFSKMKKISNPYAKILKRQITIKINDNAIEYFNSEVKPKKQDGLRKPTGWPPKVTINKKVESRTHFKKRGLTEKPND